MPIVLAGRTAEPCPSCSIGATRPLSCIGTKKPQDFLLGKKHIDAWQKENHLRSIIPRPLRRRITFQLQNRVALNER